MVLRGIPRLANFRARSVPARTILRAAMNTKRHRVVLGLQAFQRMAYLVSTRAVECAENEGWPIPAEACDPPRAISRAGALQHAAVLLRQHLRAEWHFWSGKKDLKRRIKVHPAVAKVASGATP